MFETKAARRGSACALSIATASTIVSGCSSFNHGEQIKYDQATIAEHAFDNPTIEKVVDTKRVRKIGQFLRDEVQVSITLPPDQDTKKLFKKYTLGDDRGKINWIEPFSTVATNIINKADKPQPGTTNFIPSSQSLPHEVYGATIDQEIEPITPAGGDYTVSFYPKASDPDGLKAAIYNQVDTISYNNDELRTVSGYQYLGTIALKNGEWINDTTQPPLDNFTRANNH